MEAHDSGAGGGEGQGDDQGDSSERETAMEAHDGGAGGGEGQGDDEDDSSESVSADESSEEEEGIQEFSQVVVIPYAVGHGGRAVLVVSRMGPHLLEISIRVPFLSPIEAEITRSALSPFQDTPVIHRELTVNDLFVVVRWVTEDPVNLLALLATFILDVYVIFLIVQVFMPLHSSTS